MLEANDFGVDHDFKLLDTDPAVADPLVSI